jgi:hypothetical protein
VVEPFGRRVVGAQRAEHDAGMLARHFVLRGVIEEGGMRQRCGRTDVCRMYTGM